ncbi:MAG: hypothetical protein HFACDABA_00483 [Anaerolineales bacterium]|nr:hypothetical protein [Anaerolineales bacterium]
MKKNYPAIALLVTAILAYGLLIPFLGFYWDDLPMSWIPYELGPDALTRYFSTNRPVWGLLYQITTRILPHVPIYWQIFALLLRALTGILFFAVVKRIWKNRGAFALVAAFIFLLYPGFNQQWGSYLYSHFFIVLNFFLASLYFTLRALDEPNRFRLHTSLALILSALNLWMMEYFFFLELVRPFLIFCALRDRETRIGTQVDTYTRTHTSRAAQLALPYLALWIAAVLSRMFIFNNQVYSTSLLGEMKTDFIGTLTHLSQIVLASFWTVSGPALAQIFQLPSPSADGWRVTLMVAGVILFVFVITQYALRKLYTGTQVDTYTGTQVDTYTGTQVDTYTGTQVDTYTGTQVDMYTRTHVDMYTARAVTRNLYPVSLLAPILLSLIALFFAGWPFWLIDFPPALGHPTSRFTLPFMFGVSLLMAGLLDLIPRPRLKYLLAGMLIALCAGRQTFWSNDYRLEWQRQTELFWQMTWRAPGLVPGTTVLLNDRAFLSPAPGADPLDARVFNFYADNSLAASLNWVYDPDATGDQIRYALFYPKSRIGNSLPSFEKNQPIEYDFLAAQFHGNTSQVVAFYYAPPGCLRLLDSEIDPLNRFVPDETLMREAAALSSSAWILPGGTATPPEVFGSEPARGWCYYFEQADLARQESDWEEVVRIAKIAFALDDHPNDPVERFVFIEGYAHTGDWARAQELSTEAWRVSKEYLAPMLCRLWARVALQTGPTAQQQAALGEMRSQFGCAQ